MLLTFPFLISITYASCTLPKSHQERIKYHAKRSPQDPSELDITAGPSPISVDLPPEWLPAPLMNIAPPSAFLPPPWSPNADIDSPYPSSGVSPWDDSGRSQMVDDMPLSSWRRCPEKRLDCGRCPGDTRCRRYPDASTSTLAHVSSSISSLAVIPVPTSTTWKPENDGNNNCPLLHCDEGSAFLKCGIHARCTSGFCVCDLGWKGNWRHGVGARGTEGLGTLTVYQEPGVDCDVKCETLGCGEVDQVDVGQCWKRDGGESEQGKDEEKMEKTGRVWDDNLIGPGELDTDTVLSGAIGLPSSDYVEEVTDGKEDN